jgi:hypothetical protein
LNVCRNGKKTICFSDRGFEHDPEKWKPVFRKGHAPSGNPIGGARERCALPTRAAMCGLVASAGARICTTAGA